MEALSAPVAKMPKLEKVNVEAEDIAKGTRVHTGNAFVTFVALNFFILVYLFCTWSRVANAKLKQQRRSLQGRDEDEASAYILIFRKTYTKNFGINGRYYLFKLYLSEILEKTSQSYNYFNIYTCKYLYSY